MSQETTATPATPKKRERVKQQPLQKYFVEDTNIIEIGIDEVGRGPLFGRVYTALLQQTKKRRHFNNVLWLMENNKPKRLIRKIQF